MWFGVPVEGLYGLGLQGLGLRVKLGIMFSPAATLTNPYCCSVGDILWWTDRARGKSCGEVMMLPIP